MKSRGLDSAGLYNGTCGLECIYEEKRKKGVRQNSLSTVEKLNENGCLRRGKSRRAKLARAHRGCRVALYSKREVLFAERVEKDHAPIWNCASRKTRNEAECFVIISGILRDRLFYFTFLWRETERRDTNLAFLIFYCTLFPLKLVQDLNLTTPLQFY